MSKISDFLFSFLIKLTSLVFPLLLIPYLSRVIGVIELGRISFSNSIISYFVIFGSLGFSFYSQRELSKYEDGSIYQIKLFLEIFILKISSIIVSITLFFIVYFLKLFQGYNVYLLPLSINLISSALDITYLFHSNNKFKILAFISIVFHSLSFFSVFLFVGKNDSIIYITLTSFFLLIHNITLLIIYRRYFFFSSKIKISPTIHFLPVLRLFIPTIAITFYTLINKTLIGVILTNFINQDFANYHNGLFDQADKIIKLLIVFTTSISPVLLTSNSKSFATLDLKSINNGIFYSLKMVLFISYPLFFGLLTISSSFIPIYLGEDFLDVVPLVKILSPLIFIIGLSNVTTIQIILASKSDKIFTIIVLIASLFSFISSIILIPIFYSIGAALSILLTEILIVIISGIYVYRKFNINIIVSLIRNYKYLLASILMYIVLYYFKFLLNFNNLVSISIIISLGAIIYLSLLIILKDSLLISIIKNEINKIKSLI